MPDDVCSLGLEDQDRINQNLGGGIPKGSMVIIEGEYGAGKSVLTERFAYGFCDEGYNVSFLSTEKKVPDFIQQMNSLGYDVVDYLLDEQLFFLNAHVDTKEDEKRDLISKLTQANTMWQADIIIIDRLDAILSNDETFDKLSKTERRQLILKLISFFRDITSQGKTLVLTIDPSELSDHVLSPFRSIAAIHLNITMSELGKEVRRTINVNRFSGMSEEVDDKIGFSVRPGSGLVVDSSTVA
ncbi:MAG: ATPase domain-containing protein [Halobacteria archaeon]|nr:ATPase domain-containing protein [Halobacteria archaeon]